ncbi:repressor LexA [Oceanospirillum multiglobuliferum]|uniref:transcriptional repressor LexA n=1 Tax=Oceanospirillum multiglobuliferum TaxID=64969 RepID=UPI0009C5B1B9|nr:repressor LexA [Oceanospirillum multiglobuliferum]
MIKLTKRQQEVLDFITSHMEVTGYPPTRAEIAKALGFKSPNAAEEHLRALARKGAIEMIPGTSRGIRLPTQSQQGLPVIGQVAAGSPILAQEHIDSYSGIGADFFYPKAHYMLKVKGLSMKNIGILDGDLLAVHQTTQVRNGQIVIARIGDEVTVKRFKQEGHIVYLIAENEEFEPIVIDLEHEYLAIEGVGVGVIRGGYGQGLS